MTSIYTKPLMVLLLLFVLIIGVFVIQTTAEQSLQENFISDHVYSSQKKFVDTNIYSLKENALRQKNGIQMYLILKSIRKNNNVKK